ncbi:hypothetical protein OAP32_00330 [Crocinitomicaceae bacterium]|nr:hypothetical protein [Crocinitomicaceae bacterium]
MQPNNNLITTIDKHNNFKIIESKIGRMLPNEGGFKITTKIRFVETEEDVENYLGIDFTIESNSLSYLDHISCISFILDDENKKLPIAHHKLNDSSRWNMAFSLWCSAPIDQSFLKSICDMKNVELRIYTPIGHIDINFQNPTVRRELILICRQFYNGVFDNNQYIEEMSIKNVGIQEISSNYFSSSSLKIFLATFAIGFPIVFLILWVNDNESNSDKETKGNNVLQNQEQIIEKPETEEMDLCDCYDVFYLGKGEGIVNKEISIDHCKEILDNIEPNELLPCL